MYSPGRTPVLRVSHRSIAALRDIKYQDLLTVISVSENFPGYHDYISCCNLKYAKANNQRLIFQFEWDTGLMASLSWVWGSKRPCRIIDYNASDGMFKLLPLRENDARTDRFIYPWDGRMGDATSFQSQMSDTGPRCLPPRTLDFKQTYVASPVCGVKKHVDFSIRTTREDFPLPRVEVGLAVAASAGWVDNHGIDGVFGLSPLMIDGDPDIKGTWLQHVVGFGEDQPMFWFSLQNGVERLHFGDYNFDLMQSVTNMQCIPLLHEQSDDQFWTCRLLKICVRRRDQGRTENNTRIFSTNLDINGDPRSKRDVNLPGYRCLFDTGASMSYIRKDDMDWIRERALAEGVRTWGGVTEQDGVENRDPIFIDTVQASARALCLELFFVDSLVEETEVIVGPIMFEDFTMGPEVHPDEASTAKLFRIQYFGVGCGVPDFPEDGFHDVLLGLSSDSWKRNGGRAVSTDGDLDEPTSRSREPALRIRFGQRRTNKGGRAVPTDSDLGEPTSRNHDLATQGQNGNGNQGIAL
ncbi:hypothetical protein FISHEDRAFT_55213 [Fistulina hepatica ATCC 64428]|uniref:Uncharacterized protein n=1 Tax=Fistulina hepatica ATCC 64428 TaxID=1128425 RepID=A0A0D7ANA4_9AGAR|nr:hypothetical protein FISHEDRAFT_55213 [Fistulina hepatica ATCC 64428]